MVQQYEHTFPGAQGLQLAQVLRRFQVPPAALLDEFDLTEELLERPDTRLSLDQLVALSSRARSLSGEPGIGFYLGMQKRISSYGYLGFAAMNAATLKEGLELMIRYAPTVSTALGLFLHVEGKAATLTVEEYADLGDTHDIAVFSFLVGSRQVSTALTGLNGGEGHCDIPFAKPAYFDRFAHLLPGARFEQSKLRVHFSARALDLPLVNPDRAAMRLAQEACERQLHELGFEQRVATRVRRLALQGPTPNTVADVASALGVSTRTLKRRLAAEGTTFSDLVDREREERARMLLGYTSQTLDEIAERLHYASVPNFARAFRRWTGTAPAHYRRVQRKRQ